jgi:hypothetical protein
MRSISITRWPTAAYPDDAYVSASERERTTRSLSEFAGSDGWTTKTFGTTAMSVSGVKSATGS